MAESRRNKTKNEDLGLQAAVQAAAEINAQLMAEGKLPFVPPKIPQPEIKTVKKGGSGKKEYFTAEVEINNLPERVRNLLTKGYIQEQIQWKSKAALCTKGRFFYPNDKPANLDDRPLYICIQAVTQEATNEAVWQIQQFIESHTLGNKFRSKKPVNYVAPPPAPLPLVQDKVYINLDHAPAAFGLFERVLGESGANVAYIQTETGVSLSLRGQGYVATDSEPLHFLLEHHSPDVVQSARSLALSLVGTLQQDFVQWQKDQQQQQQQQNFYLNCSVPVYTSRPSVDSVELQYFCQTSSSSNAQRVKRSSRFDVFMNTNDERGNIGDGKPFPKRQRVGGSLYQ